MKRLTLAAALERYAYPMPQDLIAQKPVSPRDAAGLLIANRTNGTPKRDYFYNLAKHLPRGAVLVFNQTKVIPAKLDCAYEGKKISLLYVAHTDRLVRVMSSKQLQPGTRVTLAPRVFFTVVRAQDKYYLLRPSFKTTSLLNVLEKYGEAPLPPYISRSPLSAKKKREEYQTVFAKTPGSIAAPTASLHFTNRLMKKLRDAGVELHYVTLHVGIGTFAPITDEQWKNGTLHNEWFSIDAKTKTALNRAKKEKRPIIAVGTTVVRTLESASDKHSILIRKQGTTNLFIRDGYIFRFVNGLITNFHVPKSSLLMLVSAFASRERILSLYRYAIKHKMRLYSFGDGMLLY